MGNARNVHQTNNKGANMKREIETLKDAFEIERRSYLRTITLLKIEVGDLHDKIDDLKGNPVMDDLKDETITTLEQENEQLKAANDFLTVENSNLKAELESCSKKLSSKQMKELKRLKRNEYQRKWYKKNKAKEE